MKIVEFLTHAGRYNAGQIAGFDDDHATFLIGRGIAKLHGDGVPRDTSAGAAANPQVSQAPDPGLATAEASAAGAIAQPPAPKDNFETVDIPDETATAALDKLQAIAIATAIRPGNPPRTKTEALEVIEAERARRKIAD